MHERGLLGTGGACSGRLKEGFLDHTGTTRKGGSNSKKGVVGAGQVKRGSSYLYWTYMRVIYFTWFNNNHYESLVINS